MTYPKCKGAYNLIGLKITSLVLRLERKYLFENSSRSFLNTHSDESRIFLVLFVYNILFRVRLLRLLFIIHYLLNVGTNNSNF